MADSQHVLPTPGPEPELLGIYLNDHLAGSAGGLELARRLAESHRNTAASHDLAWLVEQVTEDRETLIQIMAHLGIPRMRYKEPLAWLAEKAGRLKPNGHLLSRSPLSSVVEFEGMVLAVSGKLAGWRSLRVLADADSQLDPAMVDHLIKRAEQQLDRIERLRVRAVVEALVPMQPN
jgi:hypothetical protein